MLERLADPETNHAQRASIGLRLALLGDDRPGVGLRPDGVPDIVWHAIPGGEVTLELEGSGTRRFEFAPFHMARYPVTWAQYRAFIEAEDGYQNPDWWQDLPGPYSNPARQRNRWDNHPVVEVNWYEALAFCRWLSTRLGYTVRLPTEWEWQQAATGGDLANAYPWGPEWEDGRANTYESQLGRVTAVGCYPQGTSAQGVEDLSGTVFEWCQNEYERPEVTELGGDRRRVVRGGSWFAVPALARAAFRARGELRYLGGDVGVRVLCSSPILEH
jgi:formylglycine-generating enzyme required for sulfatase activity